MFHRDNVRGNAIDIQQIIADESSSDFHALLDIIDRHMLEVCFPRPLGSRRSALLDGGQAQRRECTNNPCAPFFGGRSISTNSEGCGSAYKFIAITI